ncbi:MAG TPA: GNAT family N-acetyltransferase [Methylomirabilota bacterium]|nr:GNAT family N-acetyltransferase [Methylomirabilota bacterium]
MAGTEVTGEMPRIFTTVAEAAVPIDMAVVTDIGALEPCWRALEPRAVGSPFQRFDFYDAWLRRLAPAGTEPLVVAGRRAGALAMVLPLVTRRIGPIRIAEFAGGSHANYNTGLFDKAIWPALDGSLATRVRAAVADARRDVDMLRLGYQPVQMRGHANPLLDETSRPAPHFAYDLSLDGDFEAVLQRHKGSKKRKRLRSHAKAFADVGGYRVEIAGDVDSAKAVVRAFLDQKAARLAAQGLPNVFGLPGTAEFLLDLVERGAANGGGLIDCYALRHEEGISATGIALPYAGAQFFVMNSFADDRFARVSPGEITLHHIIADAAARGFDTFDFGIGDARYKRSWCDREVELAETVMPLTAKGALAARLHAFGRRTRTVIRNNPTLHRLAQRFRRDRMADGDQDGGDGDD